MPAFDPRKANLRVMAQQQRAFADELDAAAGRFEAIEEVLRQTVALAQQLSSPPEPEQPSAPKARPVLVVQRPDRGFSKRVREMRTAQNLSAREMAEMLNVGISTLHHWEKGTSFPRAKHLTSLADLLGADPRVLTGEAEP